MAHIVRDYDKATDLTQEVFMNVYRARSSLEKSYICRAAGNTALSAIRKNRRRSILEPRRAGRAATATRGRARSSGRRRALMQLCIFNVYQQLETQCGLDPALTGQAFRERVDELRWDAGNDMARIFGTARTQRIRTWPSGSSSGCNAGSLPR